jgi:hypothetical protein
MNKSLTTEEVVIVSCLAVGWAIATIARELLAPLVALVLTLLGWRPRPPLAYVMDCGADQIRPTWDPALVASLDAFANPALGVAWKDAAPMPNSWLDTTTPRRTILQATSIAQLRSLATARGMDPASLRKPALIEAILDDIDDTLSNGATEALTAQQRNPSMGRRR